jgi:hypothetical protein
VAADPAADNLGDTGDAGDAPRTSRNGLIDEEEEESFPASDPHSDWAGPASDPEDA